MARKTKEERREEILSVSLQMFIERGYSATSVSDIVGQLGVAQGTFYYHFATKEAVLDAVVEQIAKGLKELVVSIATRQDLDEPGRLEQIVQGLGQVIQAHRSVALFLHREGNEILGHKVRANIMEGLLPPLEELIAAGVASGAFEVPHPAEAAELVLAVIAHVAHAPIPEDDPERAERLARTMALCVPRLLTNPTEHPSTRSTT